jgi:adenylylsulfate kinase-like enzyme
MSGAVVWITGRPQSGKSTLAQAARDALRERGVACCVLDSDAVRDATVPARGYSDADRDAHYATLGRLAAALARQDLIVLVPATAHLRRYRAAAREIAPAFVEVYIDAPPETCAERDEKGLYTGGATALPGRDVAYEPPERPDVIATGGRDVDAVERIVAAIPT